MIETLGLAYRYPGGAELRFRDVQVDQGGTLLLRGPSGSGKSTWLALAAGLLTATEGEIIVAGQPLTVLGGRARDAWRAGAIGLLPQKLYLSNALSVTGNLALVHYAAGLPVDHGAITRTLDVLGVADLAQRNPDQLSGGQRQRVAIARAMVMQPTVLLADEPTGNLDHVSGDEVLAALESLNARGITLLVVTHDDEVAARSRRHIRMRDGRVVVDQATPGAAA